jgi:thiamine biosynthesis protein ThiS
MAPVRITLNGEAFSFDGPHTIESLLASLGIDSRRVAVEHNLEVVKRARYAEVPVTEGAQIEIVNFVGGG